MIKQRFPLLTIGVLLGVLFTTPGCQMLPRSPAGAQPQGQGSGANKPPTVDVITAQLSTLRSNQEYIGTTQPWQEVVLRAQVEGQVLDLKVDVGDGIGQGDVLAQLDDALLRTSVAEAEAELAARQAEVARIQTQLSDARVQVERARLELQQAQADANRFQNLARDGALPTQQAEQAVTTAKTAAQILRSTQEQVRAQESAIAAAERRVVAQQAVVDQELERQSKTLLISPVNGSVLERLTEVGNLVQPGGSVLRLGDFSQVKVLTQVSELELANLRVGQAVQVRLDAFPRQVLQGRINRVSPAADPTARLVPVEVIIPNNSGRIGSGLLARLNFSQGRAQRVVVPATALVEPEKGSGQPASSNNQPKANRAEGGNSQGQSSPSGSSSKTRSQMGASNARSQPSTNPTNPPAKIFVLVGEGDEATVAARQVTVGDRADGKVEILNGLKPAERVVTRSSRPLKEGETVRVSVLSDP